MYNAHSTMHNFNYFRNPEVAAHISYNSMKSVMARERSKQRPLIPHTFQSLCTDIGQYDWIKDFYKGYVVAQDGSMAAIFSSDLLVNSLRTTEELYVDGTFSVRYFILKKIFPLWILRLYMLIFIDLSNIF